MNSEPEASLSRSNAFLSELHSKMIDSDAESRECPESIFFYQNCIAVETILSLRRDCSETYIKNA